MPAKPNILFVFSDQQHWQATDRRDQYRLHESLAAIFNDADGGEDGGEQYDQGNGSR